jgi:hypothetical protein
MKVNISSAQPASQPFKESDADIFLEPECAKGHKLQQLYFLRSNCLRVSFVAGFTSITKDFVHADPVLYSRVI